MALASTRGPRRGLFWQDWYAAWLLLRSWQQPAEGIREIIVEADDSPHVDDIIVGRSDRVTFYQLKRIQKGSFTGSDLFGKSYGTPLIRKLFLGWKKARARGGRRVEIFLVTNASLSPASTNLLFPPARFNREVLLPLQRDVSWRPTEGMHFVWAEIQKLTHADSEADLAEFLHSLHIESEAPAEAELRQRTEEILKYALRSRGQAAVDASAWAEHVYDLATQPGRPPLLDRERLDHEVRRALQIPRDRLQHHLSLPANHISRDEIGKTILAEARILGQGYLFISGPPGSGKTTLATWLADTFPGQILLRYHIFHPKRSADIESRRRATAFAFISELLDALADRLPDTIERRVPVEGNDDRAVDELWSDLSMLGRKKPVLIIVDGIDHVFRASLAKGEELLGALRRQAPEGTVFLLFGQPGWPYPTWMENLKRIDVPPFSKTEVSQLLFTSLRWQLDDPALSPFVDLLHDRTQGNPLSLFYSLQDLERFEDASAAIEAFPGLHVFGQRPHDEYALLLERVREVIPEDSSSLRRELLAWIAVARTPITNKRLQAAFADDSVSLRTAQDVLEALRPLIVGDGIDSFRILNDDFRRYAESNISADDWKVAHCRHVRALQAHGSMDEIQALAEHMWFGQLFEELASLARSRDLADWILGAGAEQTEHLYRLSCAAALRCGSDSEVIAACLTCKLALDASPSWLETTLSLDCPRTLRQWSFVVPPKEVDGESLRRRADALQLAAAGYATDPLLAETIAERFEIPWDLWPIEGDPNQIHDFQAYFKAWAHWQLSIGNPAALELCLKQAPQYDRAIATALSARLEAEDRSEILTAWVTALLPAIHLVDRTIIGAAVEHLVDGTPDAAKAILTPLLEGLDSLGPETARDVVVLGRLIGICQVDESHADALVRMSGRVVGEDSRHREFFFSGFADGYTSRGRDPQMFSVPEDRRSRLAQQEGPEESRIAEMIWQSGVVAGIANRSPTLVRCTDLLQVIRPLLEGASDIAEFKQYSLVGGARIYLPLIALAVAQGSELAQAMRGELEKQVELLYRYSGGRPTGALEALWVLDPDAWQRTARLAFSVSHLPESDYSSRRDWFDYWRSHASRRGVAVPRNFERLASLSLLGVYRKTYPGSLATELLTAGRAEPGIAGRLRRLVDVLVQVAREPEGSRSAEHELPSVLATCLATDGGLFYDEFLRLTVEHRVASPFGSWPAEIAERFSELADQSLGAPELLALWHWAAASPGSDYATDRLSVALAAQLRGVGESSAAIKVEAWARCLSPANERSPESAPSTIASPSGKSEGVPEGKLLDLSNISPEWFSAWWGGHENSCLTGMIEKGGEAAWAEVRSALAEKIAASPSAAIRLELVAGAIPSLRPGLDKVKAFEAALGYVAQRARFQEPARTRQPANSTRSITRLQAITRLVAAGIESRGAEVVRRSLRALAAMAESPALSPLVEEELRKRLRASSDRLIGFALAALRTLPEVNDETRAAVQVHLSHRNAWCRWLASRVAKAKPEWPDLPALAAVAGPISLEIVPSKRAVGSTYFSDTSSVREIYVRRLVGLTGLAEQEVREHIEREYRMISELETKEPGSTGVEEGPHLLDNGMGDAAARAIAGFAASAAPQVLPALLSTAARFDPWLSLASPYQLPREGWVELGLTKEVNEDRKTSHLLRAVGLVRKRDLREFEGSQEDLGERSMRLTVPVAPDDFSWVSENWGVAAPAIFVKGEVVPLVFYNSPFTELVRDRFQLVPRWELSFFAPLFFTNVGRPGWVHKDWGRVVEAAFHEWKTPGISSRVRPSWMAGWYADPGWIRRAARIPEDWTLLQFWRLESGTDAASDEDTEVKFGAREITIPERG